MPLRPLKFSPPSSSMLITGHHHHHHSMPPPLGAQHQQQQSLSTSALWPQQQQQQNPSSIVPQFGQQQQPAFMAMDNPAAQLSSSGVGGFVSPNIFGRFHTAASGDTVEKLTSYIIIDFCVLRLQTAERRRSVPAATSGAAGQLHRRGSERPGDAVCAQAAGAAFVVAEHQGHAGAVPVVLSRRQRQVCVVLAADNCPAATVVSSTTAAVDVIGDRCLGRAAASTGQNCCRCVENSVFSGSGRIFAKTNVPYTHVTFLLFSGHHTTWAWGGGTGPPSRPKL